MSKSYVITGTRFQRLYKAEALTSSYAASADAATIASNLCDVKWVESDVRTALFPMHGGKTANDEANINNRGLFDAAMFCAEHDVESGRHRAYAQAACYRFTIPETGLTLQSLTAAISCDPYTPDGARVAIFTSDDATPPMKCVICRTGTDAGIAATTTASDSDGDGVNDTWTTTGRYADHVAPRRVVTPLGGSATWYTGSGNVVFNPTGGVALSKYLFVFVLLENYNTSRSGYLEGSSYIQPKISITLNNAVASWDEELASGKTSIDAGFEKYGVDFPISSGGLLPLIDPLMCGSIPVRDRFVETPLTDTCVPDPDTVRQYSPGSDNHFIIVGSPAFDSVSSIPWAVHVAFGESLAGLSVDTGSLFVKGASQLIYSIGTDASFTYHLYLFPMFNCFVRYHQVDTTPYSQIACLADQHTTIMDYWPSDYSVPKPVLECDRKDELINPSTGRMKPVFADKDNNGIERDPVQMYSPFSEYTHKGMISIGSNISSISCLLNSSDSNTPLSSFAPGVRILFSSYSPSLDGKQISSFFEFVENPTIYGLASIQATEAYSMLDGGTATSVFVGEPFGIDSDSTTEIPNLSSITSDLAANVGTEKAVMLKDAADVGDTILDVGQTLGGPPTSYTGYCPTTMGTDDPMDVGPIHFTRGFGGDQQLVYVFTNSLISSFPKVSYGYGQWANSISGSATSVSYPVFVTNGTNTYVLAIMRLVSRLCPDVVAYPISADVNRLAPSISTIGLSSFHDHYRTNDQYRFNVKPCFLTSFIGTFVQFWAPGDSLGTHDFGPCKGIRRNRMMVQKSVGNWTTFDSTTGKASFVPTISTLVKPYSYSNNTQEGTCSFSYSGVTISGIGEIFGVYAPPVKYGVYVYVYGSFSSFGGMPCHSIVRIRFVGDSPVVDGVLADSTIFPLSRPNDESESSSETPIRFVIHPAKSCSSGGTFLDDDVYIFAEEEFLVGNLGPVSSCKVSYLGSSASVSACPSSVSSLDAGSVKSLLVANPDSGIMGYSRSPGSGRIYEVKVYPEDSELFSASGDKTVGLRNCMARFYEGLSSLSPTLGKITTGPVFLVGRAKKLVKAWASTESGQQIVGKTVDVWRIIFSSSCVPFSVPVGTRCETVVIDWSKIRMSEDPESYYTESSSSSSSSSSSESSGVPGHDPEEVVSRYAKCTKGTLFNVWLNRKGRVGVVPDDVAIDHAFYDASKSKIGDWELIAVIDPYSSSRRFEVKIGVMDSDVGTIALSAWYPFSSIDSRSEMTSLVGSGEAAEYSSSHSIPTVGYGFVPDITFRR